MVDPPVGQDSFLLQPFVGGGEIAEGRVGEGDVVHPGEFRRAAAPPFEPLELEDDDLVMLLVEGHEAHALGVQRRLHVQDRLPPVGHRLEIVRADREMRDVGRPDVLLEIGNMRGRRLPASLGGGADIGHQLETAVDVALILRLRVHRSDPS